MGSKSPSTPDIRQLPANTGTNTIVNNQSMIQRGFPVITDGNNNITSGLRRTDGSIVEGLGGQPLTAKVDPNVPLNTSGVSQDVRDRMRPTPNLQGADLVEQIQMRMQQRDVKTPGFMKYAQDVLDTQGYPTQSLQYYQNQFGGSPLGARIPEQGPLGILGGRRPISSPNFSGEKIIPTMEEFGATVNLAPGVSLQEAYNNAFGPLAIQSPDSTAGIMSGLPQVPTPPGMGPNEDYFSSTPRPSISPLRPPNYDNLDEYQKGYLESDFYSPISTADVRPYTYKGKEMSGSGTYVSGFQDYLNSIGQGDLFSPTPPTIGTVQPLPNGTGTQMPIGGTPLPAPIQPTNPVTGNTSPIGGSQQDFDAYMNSYVNDLINQRMKNVFGGIMNSFN